MKKGAIELSVTAIIIMILAIVMLGLGLGFIRGMFGKVTTQFEEQIAAEPEPSDPSASEPITLSRESLVTRAKEDEVLKIGIYNPTNQDWVKDNVNVSADCTNLPIAPNVNMRDVNQGESEKFNMLFSIDDKAAAGTYLCSAYVVNATDPNDKFYTKDFTIRVSR